MEAIELEMGIEHIASLIKEGKLIPFIGAGVNYSKDKKCPPAGTELCHLLAQKIPYCSNGDILIAKFELSTIAQHFELQKDRDTLIDFLKECIVNKTYQPSSVHLGLARITKAIPKVKLIITTNYDDLMEKSLNSTTNKKDHDVLVQYPDRTSDQLYYEFRPDCVTIYKMHGSLSETGGPKERDSLVITDDDYIEFLTNMQHKEFMPYSVLNHLANRHLLFLGYSLKDWDFMVLYRSLIESKNRSKIKKSYTIQKPFEAEEGPDKEYLIRYWLNTKRYWEDKNIHTLEIDHNIFIKKLLEKLNIDTNERTNSI